MSAAEMNYEQVLEYLYSQLPMFQRVGAPALKYSLDNIRNICSRLGNPQEKFKSIHIAGTNGKGSVAHMLSAILQKAGYRTGLHTSPHYKDYRERIKVDGQMVPQEWIMEFVNRHRQMIEEIQPSFFEISVAMAFDYFVYAEVDVAVIETGMGGRLDSTNIITPILSIITNINFDHQQFLGNTLELIAGEKAGIIKPKITVVIGEKHPETAPVFIGTAERNGSKIFFAEDGVRLEQVEKSAEGIITDVVVLLDECFDSITLDSKSDRCFDSAQHDLKSERFRRTYPAVQLQLQGEYQLQNLKTVFQSLETLRPMLMISDEAIYEGLAQVRELTQMPGRWQVLQEKPIIIADGAHNAAGVAEALRSLKNYNFRQLHIIFGCVADKDIHNMLLQLPKNACYYFTRPDVVRGKAAGELAAEARAFDLSGEIYSSAKDALDAAKTSAEEDDLVLIMGSIFLVAEVI